MNTILSARVLGMSLLVEVIVVALLLIACESLGPVEAGTCTGHYWSAANDDTAHTYYGAYGSNTTQDASNREVTTEVAPEI